MTIIEVGNAGIVLLEVSNDTIREHDFSLMWVHRVLQYCRCRSNVVVLKYEGHSLPPTSEIHNSLPPV